MACAGSMVRQRGSGYRAEVMTCHECFDEAVMGLVRGCRSISDVLPGLCTRRDCTGLLLLRLLGGQVWQGRWGAWLPLAQLCVAMSEGDPGVEEEGAW